MILFPKSIDYALSDQPDKFKQISRLRITQETKTRELITDT